MRKVTLFSIALSVLLLPQLAQAMHIMEGFLPQQHAFFWLAATVPFLAVIGRRIVAGELEGPTRTGKKILGELQRQCDSETDIVRQVALSGAKILTNHQKYRAFYFMTHSLPYAKL